MSIFQSSLRGLVLTFPEILIYFLQNSSVCKAAIQSGAINTSGGRVVWTTRGNMTSQAGGTRNGITSQNLAV